MAGGRERSVINENGVSDSAVLGSGLPLATNCLCHPGHDLPPVGLYWTRETWMRSHLA